MDSTCIPQLVTPLHFLSFSPPSRPGLPLLSKTWTTFLIISESPSPSLQPRGLSQPIVPSHSSVLALHSNKWHLIKLAFSSSLEGLSLTLHKMYWVNLLTDHLSNRRRWSYLNKWEENHQTKPGCSLLGILSKPFIPHTPTSLLPRGVWTPPLRSSLCCFPEPRALVWRMEKGWLAYLPLLSHKLSEQLGWERSRADCDGERGLQGSWPHLSWFPLLQNHGALLTSPGPDLASRKASPALISAGAGQEGTMARLSLSQGWAAKASHQAQLCFPGGRNSRRRRRMCPYQQASSVRRRALSLGMSSPVTEGLKPRGSFKHSCLRKRTARTPALRFLPAWALLPSGPTRNSPLPLQPWSRLSPKYPHPQTHLGFRLCI